MVAIIFLALIVVLFGSHLFVLASWSRFLDLTSFTLPRLAIASLALASFFIVTSLLSHYFDSLVTRGLYVTSAAWLGLFSNLFIATLIAWPIYLFLGQWGQAARLPLMFALAVLACGLFVFGLWNAKQLAYRSETLHIDNLPDWWRGKTVVQLSDVHIGVIYRQKFLEKIVTEINKRQTAAVFITGDFFDGQNDGLTELTKPLAGLRSELGSYFITGNHETYLGVSHAEAALKAAGVRILEDESVKLQGLDLVGIAYPERGVKKDLVGLIDGLRVEKPSILLYHEPIGVEQVAQAGKISLMLSGHTHNGQLWPYNYIVAKIFGPFATGLNQVNGMYQYTSVGTGTWGPPMRTTGRPEVVFFTLQ